MAEREVPVLIVGGSLVGLSMAMLLGHHGIRSLAVEHHRGTAIHPRAAQVNQRTMEIFREVGVEQIVRVRSDEQLVQDGAIIAVESLTGRELAAFVANLNEGIRDVSPTSGSSSRRACSSRSSRPPLRSWAPSCVSRPRWCRSSRMPMVSRLWRAIVIPAIPRVPAAYLVAADGAHSGVRTRLGIPMIGRGTFSKSVTIYFRADVAPLLRGRNLSVIYVNNPILRGFLRFEKPFDSGFLAVNALGDPGSPITDVASGLTKARAIELVRVALGSDAEVTIDNIMPWNAEANVAERIQQGRIFIMGDAAHAMTPNGGFGGNTGVHDAHNLAWKLAMVLNGTAGPELLATYEAERKPVGVFTTEQAYSRYVTRTAPYLGTDGIQPVAGDLNVELGYAYASMARDGDGDGGVAHRDPRQWKGEPGTRAPHVWLERGGEHISTLDLLVAGSSCSRVRTALRGQTPLARYKSEADSSSTSIAWGPPSSSISRRHFSRPTGFRTLGR